MERRQRYRWANLSPLEAGEFSPTFSASTEAPELFLRAPSGRELTARAWTTTAPLEVEAARSGYSASAFLQTGLAERVVYVHRPPESSVHGHIVRLLLTAAYGMANSNANCRVIFYRILIYIGFEPLPILPQLFLLFQGVHFVTIVSMIVDNFLLAGSFHLSIIIVGDISNRIGLCTIVHGLGYLRYFGLTFHQNKGFNTCVDGDDKLNSELSMPLRHPHRRD